MTRSTGIFVTFLLFASSTLADPLMISKADNLRCDFGTGGPAGNLMVGVGHVYVSRHKKEVSMPNVLLLDPQSRLYARYRIVKDDFKVSYFNQSLDGKETIVKEDTIKNIFDIRQGDDDPLQTKYSVTSELADKGYIHVSCHSTTSAELVETANKCAFERYGHRRRLQEAKSSGGQAATATK